MNKILRLALLPSLCFVTGCTRYKSELLNPSAEWARLENVRLMDLTVQNQPDKVPGKANLESFNYADGLSEDEAAAVAVLLNPGIRLFRAEKGVAAAQLVEAGLLPNPDIDSKWLTPPMSPTQWAGEVNALLNLSEALVTRGPKKERARIRIEEVKWEIADQEWKLANEVKLVVLEVRYQQEALRLNRQQVEIAERTLALVGARVDRGAASNLDLLVAEASKADLERHAKRIGGDGKLAMQALNRLLGLPPNHDTKIQATDTPFAYEPRTLDLPPLLEGLRSHRPDILAAAQAYLGAEKELQIACRRQFPRILIGPSYSGGDNEQNGRFGLGIGLDLPIFNQNQGEIAVKMADRERKKLAYLDELYKARDELQSSGTRFETLDSELKHYFAEVAPRLEKSLELAQKTFAQGQSDLLQVLLLQDRVLQSKRDILEKIREFKRADIEVRKTAGPELSSDPSTKSNGPKP